MKTKYTLFQVVLEVISIALLVLFIVFIFTSWRNIPDKIPAHYNFAGDVDRWENKSGIIFLPVVTIILYAGISLSLRFPQIWNTPDVVNTENRYSVYSTIKTMLIFLKVVLVETFFYISYCSIKGRNIPSIFLPINLIILFLPMGYFIWKIYHQAKM